MRGPAPSIVCPRCELAAPPADTAGKFTTCTRCGLSFDATARERLVPSRKPPRPPEPEATPEPDPNSYRERRKRSALSGKQVVGWLVAIFAIAYIKTEYFPSEDERERRAELERIQQEQAQRRERLDRAMERLEALRPALDVGCSRLPALLAVPATCPTEDAQRKLQAEIDAIAKRLEGASDAVCAKGMADIVNARIGHGCT